MLIDIGYLMYHIKDSDFLFVPKEINLNNNMKND